MSAALLALWLLPSAPCRAQEDAPRHLPPIQELLARPQVEDDLRDALSSQDSPARLGTLLLDAKSDVPQRSKAAVALGRSRDKRAPSWLALALDDVSPELRMAAALGLGETKALPAEEPLERKALKDPHWWVRYAGLLSLTRIGGPAAVEGAAQRLVEDPNWQVRRQAARALGDLGQTRAVPALGHALSDPEPDVRYSAVRALESLGGPESRWWLQRAYGREEEPLARAMISAALRRVSDRD